MNSSHRPDHVNIGVHCVRGAALRSDQSRVNDIDGESDAASMRRARCQRARRGRPFWKAAKAILDFNEDETTGARAFFQ
jgi:hypothetical protein